MKTLKEMITEARQVVPEEGPADLQRRLKSGEPLALIDVRDPDEYRDGHIEAATNISRGFLEFRIAGVVSDPAMPIVLYCQTGLRSVLAAKALKELGYQHVINLVGGYQKWAQSGLPTADIGKPKVESGTRMLKALNPDVNVIPLAGRITVDNVMDTIKDYDLIVDGSDNFETRYLVNDACYLAGKTNVHGSIFQFEGMATVFAPNEGPCYRCLYPTPPPAGLVPS